MTSKTNTNEKVWTTKDLIYILMLFLGFGKNFYTDNVDAKEFKEMQEQFIEFTEDFAEYKDDTDQKINILSIKKYSEDEQQNNN